MASNEGIFKRGQTWWLRYSVAGQQIRESAKTQRKEEALRLLRKRQADVFEGRYFPDRAPNELTILGLKEMWLAAKAGKRSISHDAQRFENVVAFFGSKRLVSTIRSEHIDAFKRRLFESHSRFGTSLSPATVNRYLALLRSSLRMASRRGYRHANPMDGVEFERERNERDRICSPHEYERLIAGAESDLRLVIQIGYWTGMRLGEIVGLARTQVDFQHGFLRLSRADTKEAAPKQIPVPEDVLEELQGLPQRADGRVFACNRSTYSRRFRCLCVDLEIQGLRFHDLRHTAVTRLRRSGVDLLTIQGITGHKTLKMLARYNKSTENDLRNALRLSIRYERGEGLGGSS
jgi:integrase